MSDLHYKRIVLKISGESLRGPNGGIGFERITEIAKAIAGFREMGGQLGLVVGGGNIIRGRSVREEGVDPGTADQMGMLATVINALGVQSVLERLGLETRVLSAIQMDSVAEPYIRRRALRHIEKGRVVIMAGGTGNPNFTTDTAAALRAVEIGADVLLKATKVDGVYADDPERDPGAKLFERLTYKDVLTMGLRVMDATATALCMEHEIPIVVFNLNDPRNILEVARGSRIGTLVEKE